MTGYNRLAFGKPWVDVDHNGCGTRDDILRRDLTNVRSNGRCLVASGVLQDPYTGRQVNFVRGVSTSLAVQIDHVVPLGDVWQTGAQQMPPNVKLAFANDPLELLAVDGPTNVAKGDRDAATWLPPNRAYWCSYVARQTAVVARYTQWLWMTQAEHDRIYSILSACPNQRVPS